MDIQVILDALSSDSIQLTELKSQPGLLEAFFKLVEDVDAMPDMDPRLSEESPSLYEAVYKSRTPHKLNGLIKQFFGYPKKPAGKSVSTFLKRNATVKYLGGLRKEQALYIRKLKQGEFYCALFPWQRRAGFVTVHIGYCSPKMSNEDYGRLEGLVKRVISERLSAEIKSQVGGVIHGVSIPSFLQMSETEKTTCRLSINAGSNLGFLYLYGGRLVDAETGRLHGREAAYTIISWDKASITIEHREIKKTDKIKQPLMQILMESLRRKDEEEDRYRNEQATVGSGDYIEPSVLESEDDAEPSKPAPKEKPQSKPKPIVKPDAGKTGQYRALLKEAPGEAEPKKSSNKLVRLVAAVFAALVLAGGGFYAWNQYQNSQEKKVYRAAIDEVENTKNLKRKKTILRSFINTHQDNPYAPNVEKRIAEVENLIEEEDFIGTMRKVDDLSVTDAYKQKATNIYKKFLKKYPQSSYEKQIKQKIAFIPQQIELNSYQRLKKIPEGQYDKRFEAYRNYLTQYPQGRYRKEVEKLLASMADNSYNYIKDKTVECEYENRLGECIELMAVYLAYFANDARAAEIRGLRHSMKSRRDFEALYAKSKNLDAKAAKKLYDDYLESYPESTQRAKIEEEIAKFARIIDARLRWDKLSAHVKRTDYDVFEREQRLRTYLDQHSGDGFAVEAENLLVALMREKQMVLEQQRRAATEQQKMQARAEAQQAKEREEQRLVKERAAMRTLLAGTNQRFVAGGNGTVTDTKTGLMWALLDSKTEKGECFSYKTARQYVRNLEAGGFSDWRLPTAGELAGIYKNAPYFPDNDVKIYWSSEIVAKGYLEFANVVSSKKETVFERMQLPVNKCGVVRAVRR